MNPFKKERFIQVQNANQFPLLPPAGLGAIGCEKNGRPDNTVCATQKCARYGKGTVKCCPTPNTATFGLSEHCTQLPIGSDCLYNGQCREGYCKSGKCTLQGRVGEMCAPNGRDFSCKKGLACGQYGNNQYKCCPHVYTPLGSLSDWCDDLPAGGNCYYDGQCRSNNCINHSVCSKGCPHMFASDSLGLQKSKCANANCNFEDHWYGNECNPRHQAGGGGGVDSSCVIS